MGYQKKVYFFIALAIIKLTAAESGDGADTEPTQEEMQRAPLFSLGSMPFFMGLNPSGAGSGGMPDFSSLLGSFMPGGGSGGLPNFSSLLSGMMNGGGSRDKRSAERDDGEHEHGHEHGHGPADEQSMERLFFRLPTRVACNFTTQAGATCLSCTQALRCRSNNVGSLKTCRGFFPYCNNGRCSFFPGSECLNPTNSGSASGSGSETTTVAAATTTVAAETTTGG